MTVEVRIGVDRRGGWRADVAGDPAAPRRFERREAAERWARALAATRAAGVDIVVRDAYHRVIRHAPPEGRPPSSAADSPARPRRSG